MLSGDKTFRSAGHGGIFVKGYLNAEATASATSQNPYPLAVGSIIAKAVVRDSDASATNASRVYFMRKMPAGFDPANNDWAYAVSNRTGGKLVFDRSLDLKEQLCVSCHEKFKQYDYVQTVDFFRNQTAD